MDIAGRSEGKFESGEGGKVSDVERDRFLEGMPRYLDYVGWGKPEQYFDDVRVYCAVLASRLEASGAFEVGGVYRTGRQSWHVAASDGNGAEDHFSSGKICSQIGSVVEKDASALPRRVCSGAAEHKRIGFCEGPVEASPEGSSGVCVDGSCEDQASEMNLKRGRHYKKNKASRLRKRQKAVGADEVVSDESDESVVKGRCETVVSQVQPVRVDNADNRVPVWRRKFPVAGGQPVVASVSCQEAEQSARETLALRRAMENKVAVRKAELQLRSLNDEKKCQDYEDLKRQRVIQWQNQALAKSQSSAKSLDPDSSVSMREFREQAKHCVDLEYKQQKFMSEVTRLCGAEVALKILDAVEISGEATEMEQEAQMYSHLESREVWGVDVDDIC